MAVIRPFRGVHYNQSLVGELSDVLCPPYDIISPRMQQELYRRSKYNFVRLEFGRELPQDDDIHNKYNRASSILEEWLRDNALRVDESPSLYVHDHSFTYLDRQYRRRNMICLVKIEEWDTGVIRPHEGTISKDKSDRLNLLWKLRSNTSPVLSLYEDKESRIASLLDKESSSVSLLEGSDDNGDIHLLRAVTDNEVITRVCDLLRDRPLYIADGHHRYESALTYQHERRSTFSSPSPPGSEPFDYIMMTLVDLDDSGLLILPAHRLIRGIPQSMIDNLENGLRTFFDVSEVPLDRSDLRNQVNGLLSGKKDEVRLVVYGLSPDRLMVLRQDDFSRVRAITPYFHSELYHKLNVSVIDHVILEKLLGITYDKAHLYLDYCSDSLDAVNMIDDNEYQMAIIISPVTPEAIKTIADSGDRMPRKSTYFFPKPPTGLVFYRFE